MTQDNMSAAKHTPGPWNADPEFVQVEAIVDAMSILSAHGMRLTNAEAFDCVGNGFRVGIGRDGRVIVQRFLNIEGLPPERLYYADPSAFKTAAVEKLNAAIARATGAHHD